MKKSNLLLILVCLALVLVVAVPAQAGVDLSKPGSFSKLAPEDSGWVYLSPGISLSWWPSMNAERYEICTYERGHDCSNWIDVGNVTHVTLGSGLMLHGWYYWNVRAVNAAGVTYANGEYKQWLFKVASAPGAFEKYGPVNGSKDIGVSAAFPTIFTWSPRDRATAYNICIDTIDDDQCNTTWYQYNIWDTGDAYQAMASDLLPGTTYYWQVIAVDNGVTPASSTYADGPDGWWSFTTATLPGAFHKLWPGQGATGFPTYGFLYWSGSPQAVYYETCSDNTDNNQCDENQWQRSNTTATHLYPEQFPTLVYYWQVRAVGKGGTIYADNGQWFRVASAYDPHQSSFVTAAPVNDRNQPLTPTLSWTASEHQPSTYAVCVDAVIEDYVCSNEWIQAGSSLSLTLTTPLEFSTDYAWIVRASASGQPTTYTNDGSWTTFRTRQPPAPEAFSLSSPVGGQTDLFPPVSLSWTPSRYARYYDYCVDTSDDDACSPDGWHQVGAAATSVTLRLPPGQTYYWNVFSSNVTGWGNVTNPWQSFSTSSSAHEVFLPLVQAPTP